MTEKTDDHSSLLSGHFWLNLLSGSNQWKGQMSEVKASELMIKLAPGIRTYNIYDKMINILVYTMGLFK